jgi:hypothetical protein
MIIDDGMFGRALQYRVVLWSDHVTKMIFSDSLRQILWASEQGDIDVRVFGSFHEITSAKLPQASNIRGCRLQVFKGFTSTMHAAVKFNRPLLPLFVECRCTYSPIILCVSQNLNNHLTSPLQLFFKKRAKIFLGIAPCHPKSCSPLTSQINTSGRI